MLFDLYIVKLIIDKLNHRSLMRNVRLSCTFEDEHVNISWTGLYCPKLTNFFFKRWKSNKYEVYMLFCMRSMHKKYFNAFFNNLEQL